MALISIIIPCYNDQEYLHDTLNSVVNQTLRDIEIICIEDASTDGTKKIIREFALRDSRIKPIYFTENRTASAARKAGVLHSSGRYVLFVDADDILQEEACGMLAGIMAEEEVDILQFGARIINCTGIPHSRIQSMARFNTPYNGKLQQKDFVRACFLDRLFGFSLWGKLYNGDMCRKAFGYMIDKPLKRAQDLYASFILFSFAKTYYGVQNQELYHYYYGRGVSGRTAVDFHVFEQYCMEAYIPAALEEYTAGHGIRERYLEELHSIKNHLLNECFGVWNLAEISKPMGFDCLFRYWNPSDLVSFFAFKYQNDWQAMAKAVYGAKSIQYVKKEIKTIAVYYADSMEAAVQKSILALIRIWCELGYRVVLFTEMQKDAVAWELLDSVHLVQLPKAAPSFYAAFQERTKLLYQAVLAYPVDVFIYDGFDTGNAFWDMLAVKAAKAAFIPYVRERHTGLLEGKEQRQEDRFLFGRFCDGIIATSSAERAYWESFCDTVWFCMEPIPEEVMELNWQYALGRTEYDEEDEDGEEGTEDRKDILWSGSAAEETVLLKLLAVFEEILKEAPETYLHIVPSGCASDFLGRLSCCMDNQHLADHIFLYPADTMHEELYFLADLFLLLPEQEGYPSEAVLAALAARVPVIRWDAEGRPAETILSVLKDEGKQAELSEEADRLWKDMLGTNIKGQWRTVFGLI